MDGSPSDTHEQPTVWVGRTANVFGLNQQIIGAALFVGVIFLFNLNSTLLLGPDDAFRRVARERSDHWAVIPLALLAVVGAAVMVMPRHNGTWRTLSNRHVLGAAIFAGAMILLKINPGLFDTIFAPDSVGFPWKTSYHWALVPFVAVGIFGAGMALIPKGDRGHRADYLTRQAIGVLVFAGAFFVLLRIPGLIQGDSHHWALIPVVLIAVTGAAVAVLPNRKADEGATASRFAEKLVWGLAAYPLGLIAWFYIYVLRQRVVLGYWPRPYHPDPKDAGMNFHHDSLPVMFELVPIVALGAISLIVALRNCDPNFRWRKLQALWVVALGILIALVKFDPGYFIEWWAD